MKAVPRRYTDMLVLCYHKGSFLFAVHLPLRRMLLASIPCIRKPVPHPVLHDFFLLAVYMKADGK